MKRIFYLFTIVLISGFSACSVDTVGTNVTTATSTTLDPKQPSIDDAAIQTYLTTNKITAKKDTASGLYYKVVTPGNGITPTISSTITVNYTGSLLTGNIFSPASVITAKLSDLIKGWQIGIPFIKSGGEIMLYIPSALGYANYANGSIPPNSVLIFDIILNNVQ